MITHLDFELSSLCNAGCPVCSRRQHGQFAPFEQTYWRFEDVKRVVGLDLLKQLKFFNVCGNFGDGMGNPEIVQIAEWVKSNNPNCTFHISTNGGIGSVEDYKKLAELGVQITFGIDGYGDKNELYRINAKWNKVYENITTYSKVFTRLHLLSKVHKDGFRLQFLLWDQTLDQIIPIVKMCKDLNISKFYPIKPYTQGQYTRGYNMKGEYTHSLTYTDSELNNFLSKKTWLLDEYDDLLKELVKYDTVAKPLVTEPLEDTVPFFGKRTKYKPKKVKFTKKQKKKIKSIKYQGCYSYNTFNPFDLTKESYNLYITYNGYLMPCCMIPPEYSISINHSQGTEQPHQVEILNEVVKLGLENFSLKTKSISEVFNTGILHKLVYDKFKEGNQFAFCKTTCGKC